MVLPIEKHILKIESVSEIKRQNKFSCGTLTDCIVTLCLRKRPFDLSTSLSGSGFLLVVREHFNVSNSLLQQWINNI